MFVHWWFWFLSKFFSLILLCFDDGKVGERLGGITFFHCRVSVFSNYFRGALKYHIKAYELAIHDLSQAIAIDSTCALAYFNRAVCYHDSGNYTKVNTFFIFIWNTVYKNLYIAFSISLI